MANMGPHSSDSYTSKTMSMARNQAPTPNSSPAGVLQKRAPKTPTGMGEGNTPNSSPSDFQSGKDFGQSMIGSGRYKETPAVSPLGGIPSSDPNSGGAAQLSKTTRRLGFAR